MNPAIADYLRRKVEGVDPATAAIDSVPDTLFSQAQSAVTPQAEQVEATDEASESAAPPEAHQTAATVDPAGTAAPRPPDIHMPEDPVAQMSGVTTAPSPQVASGGGSAGGAPPAPPLEAPSFYEDAARLAAARANDMENRRRWSLGEGLKQAFAAANGKTYSPQEYAFPSEEAQAQADAKQRQLEIAQQLAQKRQGGIDALNARRTEADIALKDAERLKALREPVAKPNEFNEDAFRAALMAEYPNAKAERGLDLTALHGKDALESAKATLESDKNRASQVQAAREAAAIQRGFSESQADKAAAKSLADELSKQRIPETLATIGDLESGLAKHPEGLPGVGPVAGRSLPFDLDTYLRSPEGTSNLNKVQQMQEAHRVAVTGAGAGPTELAMLNRTTISPTDRPEVFKAKLANFKDLVQARRRGIEAGYTGKQLDDYLSQLQNVKEREKPKRVFVNPKTGQREVADD